ncbi:hypothetical protein [Paenibacillus residui]|uniref:Uncharacterized protein n=1 Tax=Paenibacillus residui TaxID=629724 RepID=A0ABW3DFT5_9BACL
MLDGWKMDSEARAKGAGVNNTIWQVGKEAWLARYNKAEANRVIRELVLYEYLSIIQDRHSGTMIFVPELIVPLDGTGEALPTWASNWISYS